MISKIIKNIFGKKKDVETDITLHNLSVDVKNRIRSELSSFASIAEDIQNKEKLVSSELESKGIQLTRRTVSQFLNETLQMKHQYMKELCESKAYKEILPWVDEEVYIRFVVQRIEYEERWSKEYQNKDRSDKITKAKKLLNKNPSAAAELFFQLGTCHSLWGLQKNILKQEFNVTWYSPAELHPDTCFD